MWRPENWSNFNPCLDCPEKLSGYAGENCDLYCGERRDYYSREDGADMMYLALLAMTPHSPSEKEIVYISAPYTKGDVAQNVKRVLDVADRLLEMGYIPYIPHLTHFWHIVSPKPWEVWIEIDLRFLPFCHKLLRLSGESNGADEETRQARKLGKPIYYSIEELVGEKT